MEDPQSERSIVSRFTDAATKLMKTTPEPASKAGDIVTRSATIGILAGLLDYVLGPELFNTDRSGNNDELSALLAVAAGVFLASIKNVRILCSIEREKVNEGRWNIVKGGIGGGLSIAGLAKLATTATLLGIGGLATGGVLAGIAGTAIYNRISKKKYCPHEDCQAKGNCSQRVCRVCYRLFWPKKEKLDCAQTPFLDWYTVASYLQEGYKLSYIDSVALLEKYFGNWIVKGAKDDNVVVDCERFRTWADNNKHEIADFKGKGANGRFTDQIREYLNSKGL